MVILAVLTTHNEIDAKIWHLVISTPARHMFGTILRKYWKSLEMDNNCHFIVHSCRIIRSITALFINPLKVSSSHPHMSACILFNIVHLWQSVIDMLHSIWASNCKIFQVFYAYGSFWVFPSSKLNTQNVDFLLGVLCGFSSICTISVFILDTSSCYFYFLIFLVQDK